MKLNYNNITKKSGNTPLSENQDNYDSELFNSVQAYQNGNKEEFNTAYKVFEKLIIRYRNKLDYDDARQELDVFLAELLLKIPLGKFVPGDSFGLKKYIAVAIRNKYIEYSKRHAVDSYCIEYCDEIDPGTTSFEERVLLSAVISALTQKQRLVIEYKYYRGFTDTEIARIINISPQAVGRTHSRALACLKALICDER